MTKPSISARPLRCLHYVTAVNEELGGVVRAVLDVVTALAAAGNPTTLLTHDATDCPAEWSEPTPSGEIRRVPQVVLLSKLSKFLKRITPVDMPEVSRHLQSNDVVHLHTPWATSNVQIGKLARAVGTPYVVSLHGMLDDWCFAQRRLKKSLFLNLGGRALLERANTVHCTAEGEKRQSHPHCPRAHVGVVPCLIDLADYRTLPGDQLAREAFPTLSTPGYNLLLLSRIDHKKGVERLLDAAAKLSTDLPDLKVWIAGPGEPDYIKGLEARAQQLGIAGSVHFVGMVREALKRSLYQAVDLFVLPTSQENFGFVSVEAMLCETPIVTTKGVDIWQELQAGGAAIAEINAQSVADQVRALLNQPKTLVQRGAQGRQHILRWLDPAKVLQQMTDLYTQAINRSVGRQAVGASDD